MDCSTSGFPVLHQLPELAQTHVHQASDAIQPSHPLSSLSPPALLSLDIKKKGVCPFPPETWPVSVRESGRRQVGL